MPKSESSLLMRFKAMAVCVWSDVQRSKSRLLALVSYVGVVGAVVVVVVKGLEVQVDSQTAKVGSVTCT